MADVKVELQEIAEEVAAGGSQGSSARVAAAGAGPASGPPSSLVVGGGSGRRPARGWHCRLALRAIAMAQPSGGRPVHPDHGLRRRGAGRRDLEGRQVRRLSRGPGRPDGHLGEPDRHRVLSQSHPGPRSRPGRRRGAQPGLLSGRSPRLRLGSDSGGSGETTHQRVGRADSGGPASAVPGGGRGRVVTGRKAARVPPCFGRRPALRQRTGCGSRPKDLCRSVRGPLPLSNVVSRRLHSSTSFVASRPTRWTSGGSGRRAARSIG